jgi:hypothetical protein
MTDDAPQTATVTPLTSAAAICGTGTPDPVATAAQESSASEPAHATLAAKRGLSLPLRQVAIRTTGLALYKIGRLGPAGAAGLLATTAAVIIAIVGVVSIHNATESLAAQITRLQQRPDATPRIEDGLRKVITTLPTRDQMPVVIGQMLQQARLAGVALDTGHYVYIPPKTGGVGRYELEFPLKAEYPNVRDFINKALTAVPSAGLDKLRIERKAVGDALVNAEVRFVVFVRSESVE